MFSINQFNNIYEVARKSSLADHLEVPLVHNFSRSRYRLLLFNLEIEWGPLDLCLLFWHRSCLWSWVSARNQTKKTAIARDCYPYGLVTIIITTSWYVWWPLNRRLLLFLCIANQVILGHNLSNFDWLLAHKYYIVIYYSWIDLPPITSRSKSVEVWTAVWVLKAFLFNILRIASARLLTCWHLGGGSPFSLGWHFWWRTQFVIFSTMCRLKIFLGLIGLCLANLYKLRLLLFL